MNDRYLIPSLLTDLPRKMVLLTGPRQVGKTTLAKQLGDHFERPVFLNYDVAEQAHRIERMSWLPSSDYVLLDELHKMPQWKNYLKGVYDGRPADQALFVTGSARLDTFRQTGDSLAGRYFSYRLHPYSVKELTAHAGISPVVALDRLLRFGGFPEPLFAGTDADHIRWQNQYFSDFLREDILEFGRIHELRSMRLLVEMLRSRTGSPLSYLSLARDLNLSPITVRRYVEILEALHIVFVVTPYHRNIARALSKAPKLYFYDWTYIQNNPAASFENLVAIHLRKHLDFLNDTQGWQSQLHYVQTTSGKEVDFVVASGSGELIGAVEVKWGDSKPSYSLRELAQQLPDLKAVQLVYQMTTPYKVDVTDAQTIEVHPAAAWLASLSA